MGFLAEAVCRELVFAVTEGGQQREANAGGQVPF